MKKFFVLVFIFVAVFAFVLAKPFKLQAQSLEPRQIAQACDTQDPYSPCFAPGETSDPCDTQDPYSPCFAPGERADGTAPDTTTTAAPKTSTPKSTTTVTAWPEENLPTEADILKMNDDGDGVGILGALFLSPIMSMIVFVVGFFIFIGIIILVVILLGRRGKNKSDSNNK